MSQSSLTPEQVSYCEWLFGQWETVGRGFDEMIISLNEHLFPESGNPSEFTEMFTDSVAAGQRSQQQMKNYLLRKILAFFPGEYNARQE
jgi:hypothetical protein